MANPPFEELIKDLFFIKKIKDETIQNMEIMSHDFEELVGPLPQFMSDLENLLGRLASMDRQFVLNMLSRHERTMILLTRMIYCIEEVLHE